MSNTPAPEVKPQVIDIANLLTQVKQGRLRPARFQRPFEWDRSQVADLFDSIRKQYPIGTLLLWAPKTLPSSEGTLGPLILPERAQGSVMLIIDGQQRLASVAGVLLYDALPTKDDLDDPGMWDLWFDAEDESFKHLRSPAEASPSCIRVRDLMSIKTMMAATAALAKKRASQADIDTFSDTWQAASTALLTYRAPVVEFYTDDLDIAVESFTRLNRFGTVLSTDQMWSALSNRTGEGARLVDLIDDTLRAVKRAGFGGLDRITVFRLILFELGHNPFRTEWHKLENQRQKDIQRAMQAVALACKAALLDALQFLRDEMGLVSLRLLPYSPLVVAVAAYLGYGAAAAKTGSFDEDVRRTHTLNDDEKTLLARYCWRLSYVDLADGNPSRIKNIWDRMSQSGQRERKARIAPRVVDAHSSLGGLFARVNFSLGRTLTELLHDAPQSPPTPFPSRYDQRSARLRVSLWATMSGWDLTPEDKLKAAVFINQYGAGSWRLIIKQRRPGLVRLDARLLRSPANWMFDFWGIEAGLPDEVNTIGRLLELSHHKEADRVRLDRLQITEEALQALRVGDFERFLRLREDKMIQDERDFLTHHGLPLPVDLKPQPPAIDHPADDSDLPLDEL